jgi:hypothetical protein
VRRRSRDRPLSQPLSALTAAFGKPFRSNRGPRGFAYRAGPRRRRGAIRHDGTLRSCSREDRSWPAQDGPRQRSRGLPPTPWVFASIVSNGPLGAATHRDESSVVLCSGDELDRKPRCAISSSPFTVLMSTSRRCLLVVCRASCSSWSHSSSQSDRADTTPSDDASCSNCRRISPKSVGQTGKGACSAAIASTRCR